MTPTCVAWWRYHAPYTRNTIDARETGSTCAQGEARMDRVAAILIVSALCIWCSNPLHAQTEPIVVEAETGVLGSALTLGNQDCIQSITISSTVAGGNPTSVDRVATFSVPFPAAGAYELYARLRVGAATFSDDSFYYANGFGAKATSADTSADGDWILANGLANPVGYTLPSDKVVGGGLAQSGVLHSTEANRP